MYRTQVENQFFLKATPFLKSPHIYTLQRLCHKLSMHNQNMVDNVFNFLQSLTR